MSASALGETRSERKRRLILNAARVIFAREGFAHAGMEQVARDAGVSTATLYAYFPGKADLFRVVVEDTVQDIGHRVCRSVEARGDARARLRAFGQAYAEFYCSPDARALFRMVIAERRRFPDLADHFRDRGRAELGGTALAIIRELVDGGQIAVEKPSWAAGQLQGMIEHATLILGLVGGDESMPVRPLEAIVAEAVETFLARYGVREQAA
ncbi:MAG: TetR/AcrR family transcriptional regulator [Caulobacterales bacterium]|nr:TetR/AcrR family transcriptional regulator [Caulobacterales bacterium]